MPTKALFVIDVQKSLAEDPKTEIPTAAAIKAAITSVLATARDYIWNGGNDLNIYIVQHDDEEDETLRAGSEGWKLVFEPQNEGETLVRKQHQDTFQSNPTLTSDLHRLGITELVTCGIQSDCCVRATSKGALEAGIKVIILAGAHGTYPTGGKTAEEVALDAQSDVEQAGGTAMKWESWRP